MFSPADWLVLGAALLGIGGLIAAAEWRHRSGGGGSRRLVHVAVCLFVAATPWVFSGPGPVYLLAGAFVGGNGVAWWNGWWSGLHGARPDSWGTVAVPLAVLPAAAATWGIGSERTWMLQAAFLVLGLADPIAAWVGERVRTRRWVGTATVGGTGTFLLVAWGVTGALLTVSGASVGQAVLGGGGVALVAAATEAVSTRGTDNLFVVLAVILALRMGQGQETESAMWGALVIGGLLAGAAVQGELLTRRGAVVAGLFAATLVGIGGVEWAVPGIVFFGLSSALSFLPHGGKPGRSPRRTVRQVMANGGVAWGLLGLWGVLPVDAVVSRGLCYVGFVGALSAAAADTWATEIGVRWAQGPRSLRTFRPVPPGTSGAVSLLGTIAGGMGAGTVVGSAVWVGAVGAVAGGWMLVGGVAGMMADSLTGAFVQALYRAGTAGSMTEEAARGVELLRGWRGVDNNVVNLIGTLVGAGCAVTGVVLYGGG